MKKWREQYSPLVILLHFLNNFIPTAIPIIQWVIQLLCVVGPSLIQEEMGYGRWPGQANHTTN